MGQYCAPGYQKINIGFINIPFKDIKLIWFIRKIKVTLIHI